MSADPQVRAPRDCTYLLAEPGAEHRREPGAHPGFIMAAFGDRPASRDINALLAQVADRGASPRTVNKHRQLICAIFSYGCHGLLVQRERPDGVP